MFDAFILKEKKHFDFRVSLITYRTMKTFFEQLQMKQFLLYNNSSISLQKNFGQIFVWKNILQYC